jgi:hypothetical protein
MSSISQDPAKVVETHGKEKKRKYLPEACLKQRRHFTPFVVFTSTDGLLSEEAKAVIWKPSKKLADK